jgi:hypothetical protein
MSSKILFNRDIFFLSVRLRNYLRTVGFPIKWFHCPFPNLKPIYYKEEDEKIEKYFEYKNKN